MKESREVRRREHPLLADLLARIARQLAGTGPDARPLAEEAAHTAVEIQARYLGEDDPATARTRRSLTDLLPSSPPAGEAPRTR